MALYFYQALSKDGKKVSGYLDASSIAQVKEQLTKQGLFPVSVSSAQEEQRFAWWKRLFSRGVSTKDKILFTKQLSVLLAAGVPLLQAIELLVDHFPGALRRILVSIKDDLKEGSSFADALKKYPRTFDMTYVQLIRAGEASGKLESILKRLTEFLEREESISKKIKDAMRMPMIQLGVAVVVVAGLLYFAVPAMAENFAEAGQKLPAPTRFLMSISDFIVSYFFVILILLFSLALVWRYIKKKPDIARRVDQLMLKIPLYGRFIRTAAVVQFSYTLGVLIEGGVNLAESLDIVCKIIDNRILASALLQAREKIIKQGKIAQYLKQTGLFPEIAIYLISTGEETGQLDTMLLTVAKNYEEELRDLTDKLSSLLGPLMLVIMAVIVGFIAIAMMLPMLDQMKNIA